MQRRQRPTPAQTGNSKGAQRPRVFPSSDVLTFSLSKSPHPKGLGSAQPTPSLQESPQTGERTKACFPLPTRFRVLCLLWAANFATLPPRGKTKDGESPENFKKAGSTSPLLRFSPSDTPFP